MGHHWGAQNAQVQHGRQVRGWGAPGRGNADESREATSQKHAEESTNENIGQQKPIEAK